MARAAGVSIKTVSRVLNHEPNVSKQTHQRVCAAIDMLRYRPNMAARGLAGARTYLIGLLVDAASEDYLGGVQRGATERCRQDGFHLMVEPVAAGTATAAAQIRALVSDLRLDGVMLTPPVCDDLRVLSALDASATPYVRIAPGCEPGRAARVEVDDRAAAAQMTRLLVEFGHRQIGFVSGPREHLAALRRHDGFLDVLKDAGLTARTEWDVKGDFTFASGMAAAETMLAGAPRPTAIFAGNDDMALGVLAAAQRRGMSAPSELSVAGFDDTAAAQRVWPRLTTVRQPIHEMGRAAAEMLITHTVRKSSDPAAARQFECTLQVRESVTKPFTR